MVNTENTKISKYVNNKIKPTIGFYPIEQINCFSRAFGLCLNTFNHQFPDIYYMMNCFEKSFRINKLEKSVELFDFDIEIIKDFFGLKIKKQYLDNSNTFFEYIEKQTEINNPVIVPINLREIYYSDFYLERDWEHPFVIRGFDRDKKLFYILDSTHLKSDSQQEREFSIGYSDLYKAHNSYFSKINNIEKNFVLVFKKSIENYSIIDIFDKCILEISNIKKSPDFFTPIQNLNMDADNFEKYILNVPKYKELFFSLLFKLTSEFHLVDNETIKKLSGCVKSLGVPWRKLSYLGFLAFQKKNNHFPVELSTVIQESESDIFEKYFDSYMMKESTIQNKLLVFENNRDNIISNIENKFYFKFKGNKIHNTWMGDESPKVIFGRSKKTQFGVKIEVNENTEKTCFAAGIFIKEGVNVYYFSLDSERRINLERRSKEESIAEKIINSKNAELKIDYSDKTCKFYYKNNSEYILLCEREFEYEEIEFGIGCKTYYYPHPLSITIEPVN